MIHDQYIRNIEYKIDSLFTEYDEISMNLDILSINNNHMLLNEGYSQDNIYYNNIEYVVEATEAKKGILGKIIDGIMKIIRTIVDKVKSFFSKNKPDPKAQVSVAKSLESRTSKLMKLKPTILKGLALAGTVGAGAIAAKKVIKGRNNDKDTSDVVPSKISGKSKSTMSQVSMYDPSTETEVDVKSHEELEKIAKEMRNTIEVVKEEKKKESKETKSNTSEYKFDAGKITQRIKELTEVLVNINKQITNLSNELDTLEDSGFWLIISTCKSYVSEVNDTVNEMMHDLYHDINELEDPERQKNIDKIAGFITKSSEMRDFDNVKDKTMSNINATKSRAVEKAKSVLSSALDEFEKIDREKKHPEGKKLFNALKKLQHLVLNPDKYDSDKYHDEYLDLNSGVIPNIILHTRDLNPEYKTITDKITSMISAIHENNEKKNNNNKVYRIFKYPIYP